MDAGEEREATRRYGLKGIFITMEGPDGSGKTTQIEALTAFLREKGYEVVITREPGGTPISEAVRGVLLDKSFSEMAPQTEMLLYAAARAQLVEEVIKPAVDAGKAVISDRFIDSSVVYQGIARGLGIDAVYDVNRHALAGIKPDKTFLLYIDAEEGIRRKKHQAELDRMERESLDFHIRVAEGYLELAKRDPARITVIDAAMQIDQISDIIKSSVEGLIC